MKKGLPDRRTSTYHAQFKLLVANLDNAGLKVTVLEQTFAVDRKTMRRWGQALLAGNAEPLARVLEGRRRRRKLTPEMASFIAHRFAEVYQRHRRRSSAELRREVLAVFGVSLSGEAIRPLLHRLRTAAQTDRGSSPTRSASVPVAPRGAAPEMEPEAGLPLAEEGRKEAGAGVRTVEKACELGRERTGPRGAPAHLQPVVARE